MTLSGNNILTTSVQGYNDFQKANTIFLYLLCSYTYTIKLLRTTNTVYTIELLRTTNIVAVYVAGTYLPF